MLHVHSSFSDGEFTLAELRDLFLLAGCRYVLSADHADAFDEARVEEYVRHAAELSTSELMIIPGLEYPCERRLHVIGYGCTVLTAATDPQIVFRHIRANGGVSVIAHPRSEDFDWIETFDELPDGIEVWNSKYDGPHAPRPETFRLVQRLRARHPALRAFYGQDLHWRRQDHTLFTELAVREAAPHVVLDALRAGQFVAQKSELRLDAQGTLPHDLEQRFAKAQARTRRRRRLFQLLKKMAGPFGRRLPPSLKARLRRAF